MTPASSERAGCACPWACGSQFSAKPPAPSMIVSNGWLDFGSGCKLVLSACLAGSRGAEVIVIMQNQHYVAVDVSKAMLDVALPSAWRTPNTPAGLAALTRKLGGIERPHAVCEATGRYGRLLAREMDAAGIAFSSVNPRQSLPPRRRGCAILPAPPGSSPRPIPLTRVPSLGSLAPCTPRQCRKHLKIRPDSPSGCGGAGNWSICWRQRSSACRGSTTPTPWLRSRPISRSSRARSPRSMTGSLPRSPATPGPPDAPSCSARSPALRLAGKPAAQDKLWRRHRRRADRRTARARQLRQEADRRTRRRRPPFDCLPRQALRTGRTVTADNGVARPTSPAAGYRSDARSTGRPCPPSASIRQSATSISTCAPKAKPPSSPSPPPCESC